MDIYAPGVNIQSKSIRGQRGTGQGTSFAAPYVSRLAAILWARDPLLQGHPRGLKDRIKGNGKDLLPTSNKRMIDQKQSVNNIRHVPIPVEN